MIRAILGILSLLIGWGVVHGALAARLDGTAAFPPLLEAVFFVFWTGLFLGGGILLWRRWALASAVILLALAPFWLAASGWAILNARGAEAAVWLLAALGDLGLGGLLLAADLAWLRHLRRPGQ